MHHLVVSRLVANSLLRRLTGLLYEDLAILLTTVTFGALFFLSCISMTIDRIFIQGMRRRIYWCTHYLTGIVSVAIFPCYVDVSAVSALLEKHRGDNIGDLFI